VTGGPVGSAHRLAPAWQVTLYIHTLCCAYPHSHASYVTVDEDAGRALFYVLAEAVDESPAAAAGAGAGAGAGGATKPLVLWLNGCVFGLCG
jgi:hypothetical protein